MAKQNVFGQPLWLKKKVLQVLNHYTRRRVLNDHELTVEGAERLAELPECGVLFVANHHTVFTDVIAMYSTAVNTLNEGKRLRNPKLNLYYVAARESMKKGLLPRVFTLAGAVLVERSWRSGAEHIERQVRPEDIAAVGSAIRDGWVFTFPQGTTRPGAPVRKGTAHMILEHAPVVVPVRVDGFREAFDKSGLKTVDPNVELSISFGEPLVIDATDSVDSVVIKVANAIGEPHDIEIVLDQSQQILAS